jgi:hypothetical protein
MGTSLATEKGRIEYLIERRFPGARSLKILPSLSSSTGFYPDTRKLAADVEAYRSELRALSAAALEAQVLEEQIKEREEQTQRAEAEERARYYNQPGANPDFVHWSRAAHWTLDEAIALSFGKAPELVRWDQVQHLVNVSPFAFQYARRRDLALRAAHWQQLFDPVLPGIFIAWCKRNDISVPTELEAAVTARGVQVADWRKRYEEAQAAAEKSDKDWAEFARKQRDDWSGVVKDRDELIASLQARVTELETQLSRPQDEKVEKLLRTRERESLLKLVIGMAVGGYGYDHAAKRSEQPASIADDLSRLGVGLDIDTVRKWLKQASELLPPEQAGG